MWFIFGRQRPIFVSCRVGAGYGVGMGACFSSSEETSLLYCGVCSAIQLRGLGVQYAFALLGLRLAPQHADSGLLIRDIHWG